MTPRPRPHGFDDEGDAHGDGTYCDRCRQEYLEHCPIRSSRCPFEDGGDAEEEDETGDDA